ncbi:MAG: hypothetical protein EZS28_026643 [Streblomastix strix]|uniref:Uncharacterized protein n=1 Tax=Streblomastix strix TaxID=222440 RepID=A0A5J4V615_9EUKA|nr:MAG: hypothetical protein EZS28_026643 [Streblomastix strix]
MQSHDFRRFLRRIPCLQGRRGQQLVIPFSPYLTSLLRYHCGSNIVGARKILQTGTIKVETVCELQPTKVHRKDTRHDHRRATETGKRDREVSSV